METTRLKKTIAIMLAVLFIVTVTATAISAGSESTITDREGSNAMFGKGLILTVIPEQTINVIGNDLLLVSR